MPELKSREDPLFVLAKGRSGSTYLADLLCAHPDIGIAPESQIIARLWQWSRGGRRAITTKSVLENVLDEVVYSEKKFLAWQLPKAEVLNRLQNQLPISISELGREVLSLHCQKAFPGCTIWGIKKGGWYKKNIDTLRKLFPEAQFLLLYRDGRAVFASSKRALHSTTGQPFETNVHRSALEWKKTVAAFDAHAASDYACEVQFEQLVRELQSTLRDIFHFLNLEVSEEIIAQVMRSERSYTIEKSALHLHKNVGKKPQASRIDAWKSTLSAREIRAFERIAGTTLTKKGYTLEAPTSRTDKIHQAAWQVCDQVGALRGHVRRFILGVSGKDGATNT